MENRNIKKLFAVIFLLVLLIEISITTIFQETILRPVFGDFLVVILIYSFFRTVTKLGSRALALLTLCLAYCVELAQLMRLRARLGLTDTFSGLILGTSFDWLDILAYSLGVLSIYLADILLIRKG